MGKLYHYCNECSFRGIVKSKTIWLSDLKQTNDPFEIFESVDVISKNIVSVFEKRNPKFASDINESMRLWKQTFFGFGLSCCGISNNQRLWNDYAKGSTGYCLEIDEDTLKEKYRSIRQTNNRNLPESGAAICPIEYADKSVINQFLNTAQSLSSAPCTPILNGIIQKTLICSACFIKPVNENKWEEEQEIRIAVYGIMTYPTGQDRGDPVDEIKATCAANHLIYLNPISTHINMPLIPGLVSRVICGRNCIVNPQIVRNEVQSAFGDIPVIFNE